MPANSMGQTLADFCTELQHDDVPAGVRRRAHELTLDFLAVAARATRTASSAMIRKAARTLSGPGPSPVIGADFRLVPQYAALANGATGHAIEMDDVTEESSLHPGVVVFPAALAMAEACHANPREFVTAVVTGYEVICRLGNAINIKSHYARGFHPTATCGTFAAAAVAARRDGIALVQTEGGLTIECPARPSLMLGHRANLSLRAENVRIGPVTGEVAPNRFRGWVTAVEYLGTMTTYAVACQSHTLKAMELGSAPSFRVGTSVECTVNPDAIILFDV